MISVLTGEEVISRAINFIQSPPVGIDLPVWKNMNEMIGGLRPNEFTIFCGATGSGKTQWLSGLVAQLISENIKCFVAPVETGATDFGIRILSVLSEFDFNTGIKINMPGARKLHETIESYNERFCKNLFFSSYDNRVSVEEMIQTLHYMQDEKGVKVAVLDNLNFFLKPTSSNNALIEMDEAVHSFVMLAKKIPIHIILVMHPKKTEGRKITSEFDIKGSSTAVQEATNVLLMNRLDEKEMESNIGSPLSREFVFVKIRKRGFNVGKKFYMDYKGGTYVERTDERSTIKPTRSEYISGND